MCGNQTKDPRTLEVEARSGVQGDFGEPGINETLSPPNKIKTLTNKNQTKQIIDKRVI